MKMKQTFALLCAGAMVITGSAFPVNVQASADWVWNEEVSESGYKKVPYTELTTTADTEADNESSTGEGAASPGTGHAVNATDGVITSYYHSCYSGDNQPNREDGALTGNNTITVELQNAQSIQGITYLPRQDAFGNGTVTEFSVSVQKDGTENWENVGNNLHISYNNPGANWSAENKSEKEFVFDAEVENVKKVKLTVIHTDGSAPNQHISAAEISILTPVKKDAETEALKIRIREKLAQMESQMELNVLSGNADSGKVYSRAKFDPIKAEAEAKLAQESTTKEELEAVFQQLEQFKMEFQDELGTGVYVSDLTHLSGNTAWGGVKKDLCPDGNRLIAIKKDTSTINTYTKGIGAHEPSSIVYDVTGYKMFSADIGVENHQIASDGGVFANVKAKFKVSTSTDGSNYTQQYYAEDLSANGGLRSIRVKLPEGTTHMKLECPASAWNNGNGGKLHTCWANAKLYETVEIAVTGITLDQDALALKVGGTEEQKTATLQAAITPEDATDQEVLWESDNEEVATVDGGVVTASSIVYDVTGYKMFSADIGVENHQIASDGGVFANVKAKFKVSTSTDGSNYTQQYYAEDLSANGGLRSIRVKLPEGTTHMKLECPASAWNNGNGGKLHTCWANAKLYETVEIAVTGITLDQDALALKVGGTEEQKTATLQAAITPEDATDQEVLWESDNEEVATVDGGVVTAHKAGNATIKVSSVNYPNITAQCIVTVTRDDTALEEAIAAAESRMKEENFAEKYTEATRKALEDDLADAKAAKDNTALSVEEVKLIVESLKTSIEGLQLKAVVTINNNGNTETKYCEVGDQVRVVAAQAPEGKKFSHWTVNEKPICYNESYTFTVYKDIAVTSVYVEEAEEIQKEVSVLCDVSYANGRVKFLSKYSVPTDADYKVIKAGVVATDSTGYAAIQEVQQELTLDTTATTRLKKYGVNTDLYLANFTQYLKTSRTTTWYARGYVTYQDNSGEQHTVYSDMAQYTIR